jgi:hypothetical protein
MAASGQPLLGTNPLDHSEFLAGLHECLDTLIELLAGVGGADLGADAGFAFGDDRKEETHRIDAVFEEFFGKLLGQRGIA